MLNIYLADEMEKIDKEVIDDVEAEFIRVKLSCSGIEQTMS